MGETAERRSVTKLADNEAWKPLSKPKITTVKFEKHVKNDIMRRVVCNVFFLNHFVTTLYAYA